MKYIGLPYIWGAKDPQLGLDCSGLIYNIFKYDLKIMPSTIMNSQQYYNYFKVTNSVSVLPGCTDLGDLVFFGSSTENITHIAICLSRDFMIEAAHGGPNIINKLQADMVGAKVMVNPITRRRDCVAAIRPNNIIFKTKGPDFSEPQSKINLSNI